MLSFTRVLVGSLVASLLFAPVALAGDLKTRLESAKAVVWLGVDLTPSSFFVPETFDDPDELVYFAPQAGLAEDVVRFAKPDDAWEQLSADWNTIAQNVLLEKFEMAIQREIQPDLPSPSGQTQKKSPYWLSQYEYKTTPADFDHDDVKALVKKYRLKAREGIGYVIIVERASRIEKQECLWETFFDIKTRDLIKTGRVCEKPGGSTFREYWISPVLKVGKETIKGLEKGDL